MRTIRESAFGYHTARRAASEIVEKSRSSIRAQTCSIYFLIGSPAPPSASLQTALSIVCWQTVALRRKSEGASGLDDRNAGTFYA
jgi:hypothetical protein